MVLLREAFSQNLSLNSNRSLRSESTLICLSLSFILVGCGSLPNAKVNYYLAKTSVNVRVVQTIACDNENHPIIAATATPTVSHSADIKDPQNFDFSKLRSVISDADVKIEKYDDGRLKSLNTTTAGQGEAIIKSATSLLSALILLNEDSKYPTECAYISKVGGGKPISLGYSREINFDDVNPQPFVLDEGSAIHQVNLKSVLSGICAKTSLNTTSPLPIEYLSTDENDTKVKARQPALYNLEIGRAASQESCQSTDIWNGVISVAHKGTDYDLVIPKPTPFGKVSFGASFDPSGALTGVQYLTSSGVASAISSVNHLANISQGESLSTQATNLKAEADIIAQQQRLIRCKANPADCT